MFSDSIILTVLITLLLLGILVAIHEAGHFFVARWCGVKVLRFSIGFGKAIWRKVGRDGTEYVVAILPLGGYMRMLDSRTDTVTDSQTHAAFDYQSVYRRIAIVAAGPIVNLLFAMVLYSGIHYVGVPQLVPVIGQPVTGSVADIAGMAKGEKILAIDGSPVNSWQDIHWQLVERAGQSGTIDVLTQALDVERLQSQAETPEDKRDQQKLPIIGTPRQYLLPVSQWLTTDTDTSPTQQIGWQVWRPEVPVYVDQLVDQGAAQLAGLQPDDLILAINQQPTPDFATFVDLVQSLPEQTVAIQFEREGVVYQRQVTLQSRLNESGDTIGMLGIGIRPLLWPQSIMQDVDINLWKSIQQGAGQTYQMISLTLGFIKRIFSGLIPVEHLSGPISIAQVAATSASMGWVTFFTFMAYLSVSLGVLNLLPIPMLDGGHLLYYIIELVTGKKVSDKVQSIGFRIGLVFIFAVMAIAIVNDFSRL